MSSNPPGQQASVTVHREVLHRVSPASQSSLRPDAASILLVLLVVATLTVSVLSGQHSLHEINQLSTKVGALEVEAKWQNSRLSELLDRQNKQVNQIQVFFQKLASQIKLNELETRKLQKQISELGMPNTNESTR